MWYFQMGVLRYVSPLVLLGMSVLKLLFETAGWNRKGRWNCTIFKNGGNPIKVLIRRIVHLKLCRFCRTLTWQSHYWSGDKNLSHFLKSEPPVRCESRQTSTKTHRASRRTQKTAQIWTPLQILENPEHIQRDYNHFCKRFSRDSEISWPTATW